MSGNLIYFFASFLVLITVFAVLNLIILFLIRKNTGWPYIILAGTGYALAVMAFVTLAGAGFDVSAAAESVKEEISIELSAVLGMSSAEEVAPGDKEQLKKMAEFIVVGLYPGRVLLQILFIVFLNYFVVRLFMIRREKEKSRFPEFHMWYLDEIFVRVFIAGLALFLAGDRLLDSRVMELAGANIMLVLGFFYLVTGFSIVSFYLKKYRVNFFIKIIIYFAIVMWLLGIILLTGVLDTWFNFRKIEKGGSIWK